MHTRFNPKVSIVIPVYNGSNYLREAIDSALAQTYKNIEIIVVNDGSSDKGKTDKICKSYGKKIRYFKKENGGVSSSLNMGVENMKGEYFSWLSHDDVYYPDKVKKQVSVLKDLKSKNVLIYSNVEYIDKDSKLIFRTKYEEKYSKKSLNSKLFPVLKGLTNGCAILIPKECLEEIGPFNEQLKTANDYEMWFRLFRVYSVVFVPEVLIRYRFHEEQGTKMAPPRPKLQESDSVWSSVIEDLKEKEIRVFEKDLFQFYYNLAMQMKADSRKKSYKIAFERAQKYFDSENPVISVVMPCYNTDKYIKIAIDSILEQTYSNFELIIIDDKSTDKCWEMIQKYKKKDFRIRIARNRYKKGVSGAVNTGMKMAKGRYVTRMDSDDISLPERLAKQRSFLEKNKEYGLCSVNMSAFGEINVPFLFKEPDAPLEWLFFWLNPIACASTMYRTKLLKDSKIIFRDYRVAGDYDFLCQVFPYAKPAMLYDESLYQYRILKKSVFHGNEKEAIANSIKINRELIKSLTEKETPSFHWKLTDFNIRGKKTEELQIYDVVSWVEELLEFSHRKWKWSEKEYLAAKKESENRIRNYIIFFSVGNIRKKLLEKEEEILRLKEQQSLLQEQLSQKSGLLLRKAKRLIELIRIQGIKVTLRNIILRIKEKFSAFVM